MIANRKRSSSPVGCAILSIDCKDKKKPNRALFRAHHSFQREMSLSCFFSTVSHLENSFNIHTEIEFPMKNISFKNASYFRAGINTLFSP